EKKNGRSPSATNCYGRQYQGHHYPSQSNCATRYGPYGCLGRYVRDDGNGLHAICPCARLLNRHLKTRLRGRGFTTVRDREEVLREATLHHHMAWRRHYCARPARCHRDRTCL